MNGQKPQRKSMTIISAFVILAAQVINYITGRVISEDQQQELIQIITNGSSVVFALTAWWGRVRATEAVRPWFSGKRPPGG